jgi:hypothetical protein
VGASSALRKTGPPSQVEKRTPARAGRHPLRPSAALAASDPAYRIVLMAVEALDELVADMIRNNHGHIPRDFFDWIADEMTPRLEIMAFAHFGDHGWPGMAAASATRDWVRSACQLPIEQKLKGMSLHAAHQIPDSPDPSQPSRAG